MAHFLKGKFRGFYKAGTSECVRDVFRFKRVGENKLYLEVTRRDLETYMQRFWKYEQATINLVPVDEAEPRLGGKVIVSSKSFDFQTLTPAAESLYGIYSDNMLTFGRFDKTAGNPLDDEELLLKLTEDVAGESNPVLDKVTFTFSGNQLTFQKEVNEERLDAEVNHAVEATQLDTVHDETWIEALFYGRGNAAM